jgi:hypothetical protein
LKSIGAKRFGGKILPLTTLFASFIPNFSTSASSLMPSASSRAAFDKNQVDGNGADIFDEVGDHASIFKSSSKQQRIIDEVDYESEDENDDYEDDAYEEDHENICHEDEFHPASIAPIHAVCWDVFGRFNALCSGNKVCIFNEFHIKLNDHHASDALFSQPVIFLNLSS